jgi:hypothetical protein
VSSMSANKTCFGHTSNRALLMKPLLRMYRALHRAYRPTYRALFRNSSSIRSRTLLHMDYLKVKCIHSAKFRYLTMICRRRNYCPLAALTVVGARR